MSLKGQTRYTPNFCIDYCLSMGNLLANEFSENFLRFCGQYKIQLTRTHLKEAFLLAIRQFKQCLLFELERICVPKCDPVECCEMGNDGAKRTRQLSSASIPLDDCCSQDTSISETSIHKSQSLNFFRRLSLRKLHKG